MIELHKVSKRYAIRGGEVTVLDQISLTLQRGERLGILGRNGAGKTTMVRLLGGVEQPSAGHIRRDMSISWPLAFGGAFQGSLTGLDNLRFICRVYGTSTEDKIPFVKDFSELGRYFYEPVKSYSAGMTARLAFALSMVIEFDCFLIDEVVAVGDQRFTEKCNTELFEKRSDRAMVFVSHQRAYIEAHCNRAAVLHEGRLHQFGQVADAFAFYEQTQHL